ncbi:uncharacterized protein P884DRAFT_257897 [Thermothelomyces heterothallicus CBS 202.75]|uniref:uncharacterized protein n=1 Tax=Thermothelomyces heterothallicus CBS 202.75 TaxID=1149848 RepID=UPI0037435EA0
MLLPSALPCDSSSQTAPLTRLQSALFASPPASPPHLPTQTAIGNLFSTCRSLQSLLANPAAPSSAGQDPTTPPTLPPAQLPSPPLAHAPPPFKLRLRSRKTDSPAATGEHGPARMRIVKRTSAVAQQAPRGPNKRRRAADDDMGRHNQGDSDLEREADESRQDHNSSDGTSQPDSAPHTPKRSRIAPEIIPLGLERADYHSLHSSFSSDNNDHDGIPSTKSNDTDSYNNHNNNRPQDHHGTDVVVEADGEAWSTEEDRILVELVLEKLKLTKSDWQDCARSLGKDRGSVGRRWKSLMINGDVGLKRAPLRRPRIHGTWR